MIKLSEFLIQGSLFTEIGLIDNFPFTENALLLDKMLSINDGDKLVFDKYNSFTLSEIANILVLQFGEQWKQIIAVNALDFTVGTRNGRELIETITDTKTRDNTNDKTNKTSAFNTDELITVDGSDSTGSENESGTRTRTLTDSTGDIYTAYKHLNMQAKNNIIHIVLSDVGEYLTLSIY